MEQDDKEPIRLVEYDPEKIYILIVDDESVNIHDLLNAVDREKIIIVREK